MTKLRIYTASKLKEATRWHQLQVTWTEFDFVARWPWEHCGNIPDTPDFANWFWTQDMEDVARCDVVLVYAGAAEDHLRGALVEAGMGLALRKTILVVSEHADYGTWQYHPQVRRVKDFEQARVVLQLLAKHGCGGFKA